jgi:nicotinic acid mononucleotide adenylyltransferase
LYGTLKGSDKTIGQYFETDLFEYNLNVKVDISNLIGGLNPDRTFNFYFLIGADNISQLQLWHNIDQILEEIKVVAGKRPPFKKPEIENDISKSIEYIQTSELQISSTEIKQYMLSQDYEKLRTILHPDVLQYIKERKLYSQ